MKVRSLHHEDDCIMIAYLMRPSTAVFVCLFVLIMRLKQHGFGAAVLTSVHYCVVETILTRRCNKEC